MTNLPFLDNQAKYNNTVLTFSGSDEESRPPLTASKPLNKEPEKRNPFITDKIMISEIEKVCLFELH